MDRQAFLQRLMKHIHPSALSFDQRLVIDMRVTNEYVVFVIREKTHSGLRHGRPEGYFGLSRSYITTPRILSPSNGKGGIRLGLSKALFSKCLRANEYRGVQA